MACHVDADCLEYWADIASAKQLTVAVSLCKLSTNAPFGGGLVLPMSRSPRARSY